MKTVHPVASPGWADGRTVPASRAWRLRRRALLAGLVGAGGAALGMGGLDSTAWAQFNQDQDQQAPSYGPANWMRIPRIEVDSATVDVELTDGYYDVPWFDVGHHVDSANPGEIGNSVFNGHVLTINAGRVFSRLKDLVAGDAVFVYTPEFRTGWSVASTFSVADGDETFLVQTSQPRLTLYTCTGSFNPLERSYSERLVVVAQLVESVAR